MLSDRKLESSMIDGFYVVAKGMHWEFDTVKRLSLPAFFAILSRLHRESKEIEKATKKWRRRPHG